MLMNMFQKAGLALCILSIPTIGGAQMTPDPVSWTAVASKRAGKTYDIRISSTLKPGWHIYAVNPGGDGSLIATSFSFKPAAGGAKPTPVQVSGKAKAMEFPGVEGTAYVYEGKTDFTSTVTGAPGQVLNLTVGYQPCNEQMCLPPKKKVLSIKLP